jgi:hypothetical protein
MNATSMPATLTPLFYLAVLTACCFGFRSAQTLAQPATSAFVAAKSPAGCLPTRDGYLRARIRGERNIDIDWHDVDMQCDGGLRPLDRPGMRVTFMGSLPQDRGQVRLIFGISAPDDAATARNVPANVTVIFEDEQRLYSTAGDGKCTIDELSLQPAPIAPGSWRRLVARGFCTVPVTTLGGSEALELDRFDFAGGLRDED